MKILLIDDDRDDGQILKEALEEIDPSIYFTHYESPQEGLQKLSNQNIETPDLIFLDINMPVVSGWQCLNEFKKTKHLKKIPVYMYSTSSQKKEKEIAMEMGAAGFITKPDNFSLLKDTIRKIVDAAR